MITYGEMDSDKHILVRLDGKVTGYIHPCLDGLWRYVPKGQKSSDSEGFATLKGCKASLENEP